MAESQRPAGVPRMERAAGIDNAQLGGPPAMTVDGLVLLVGLFTAIAPWVVQDFATAPRVVLQNVVLGVAVALIGLVLTTVPSRGYALSWVLIPIGVWQIITPWVTGQHPTGVAWTNVVVGAVTLVLGLAAAGMLVSAVANLRRPQHTRPVAAAG